MPEVGKWQQSFFHELFRVVFALRGRVNFVNLSRYSVLGEQTFRRQFGKFFDWLGFNLLLLTVVGLKVNREVIGALDASYLPIENDGPNATGALVEKDELSPSGSNTVIYFASEDCTTEESRVEAAGGSIIRPKMPIGEFGFISLFSDPDGNTIGLHSRK